MLIAFASEATAAERELILWDTKELSLDLCGEGACDGDFNKDGVVDVVSGPYWYQGSEFTTKHEQKYDPKGYSDNFLAFVHDFNKDGWDDILNRYGMKFSLPHTFDVADFNGDGFTDFVVGKRFWTHGPPQGDPEPNAAAVTDWFELKRGGEGLPGGVNFVPHLIHDDSGVGTQVAAGDINGDGLPDVISGNTKSTHVIDRCEKSEPAGLERWAAKSVGLNASRTRIA